MPKNGTRVVIKQTGEKGAIVSGPDQRGEYRVRFRSGIGVFFREEFTVPRKRRR